MTQEKINEIKKQIILFNKELESQRGNKRDSLVIIDDNYVDLSEVSFISSLDISDSLSIWVGYPIIKNKLIHINFSYKIISYKEPIKVSRGFNIDDIFPNFNINYTLKNIEPKDEEEYIKEVYNKFFSSNPFENHKLRPNYQEILDKFIRAKERHHKELLRVWSGINDLHNIKRF